MTRTSMTLATLLALTSSGLVFQLGKETAPIEVVEEVDADAVELKTADAPLILEKLTAGSARGKVVS